MSETSRQFSGFDVPNLKRVLAAAGWILLAMGAFTSDSARRTHREYRLHPNDPGSVASQGLMNTNEPIGVVAGSRATPGSSPQSVSTAELEREKRRRELMYESTLAYGLPSPGGLFGDLISIVPCWLLFAACAALMLLGEAQIVVGCALGGWALWAWACQVAILDTPRWT